MCKCVCKLCVSTCELCMCVSELCTCANVCESCVSVWLVLQECWPGTESSRGSLGLGPLLPQGQGQWQGNSEFWGGPGSSEAQLCPGVYSGASVLFTFEDELRGHSYFNRKYSQNNTDTYSRMKVQPTPASLPPMSDTLPSTGALPTPCSPLGHH